MNDVNPDAFFYVSDDGKYKLEIATDGSVGLIVGVDKQPDRWKYTYFPYAKVRVLSPFDGPYITTAPDDKNDYSGVKDCPLIDASIVTDPVPTPVEQLLAHAEALERVNAAIDRHLDLRSQVLVMGGMEL